MPSDHPHTPQSPSQASPNSADFAPKSATSPRPTHSLPTPAHSINGSMSSLNSGFVAEGTPHDEASNKRKRDIEDHGDRDQKKVHIESSGLGINIEDLHVNVGEKYLLCRTPHYPRLPSLTEDLFKLYDLEDVARSVARTLPDGSKGEKVYKSYKSKMKKAGLSGAFNPVKKDKTDPTTLLAILDMPEDEWNAQNVRGKEIDRGLTEAAKASMSKAFTMARGELPKSVWDNSVLGDLIKPDPPKVVQSGAKTQQIPQNAGVVRAQKADLHRPKRNVKKRTYGDSSFEGYGEGFVDDDAQETGYSTGEGDDRQGSRKRPKKTTPSHSFQNAPMRQNSYGPGMVGA